MSNEILINVTPQETRVAMLEQGVVQELHVERASARGLVGNIYLGRVARVLPGMQSAFIEIGLERAAFLHIADIWEHRQNGHGHESKPIERILHEGQSLLVQVIKDPIGTKGARLSTQVSLAGRLLVYLPQDSHIGISQRIEDEAEREVLRGKLQQLLPEGLGGGFIIRTMAETATEREMQNDIEYLTRLWQDLTAKSTSLPAPSPIYQDLYLAQRVLRDMTTEETLRVLVDSRETFQKMQEFAQQYTQNIVGRINHYTGERPLFDLHGVEDEIQKALARRVDLKSGGYLIIDQTEAMTTIDVNTGGFVGGRSFDDTIFKTNLEAAQVIARQLRMRNLGGIIVIDFIDMENADHRASVLAELDKALERDRTRLTVNGFTQLGLVEMTRKRTRESLAHVLCEPCPTCTGRGELKTAQTVCYEILREIVRE
jgi:ribonuclease G